MQARQPTYFETLLTRLREPVDSYLKAHPQFDAFNVLIAQILTIDGRTEGDLDTLLLDERFLKAGRAYTALLLENDRLPRGEQLTLEELTLPEALLLDFFKGDSDIQSRAQEVLGLIERKFSQRAFQQANILLQLFETDQSTRLQNERKLFYEDMIQRLGIRRRQPLPAAEVARVREHFQSVRTELEEIHAFDTSEEDKHELDDLAAPITPWDDARRRARRLVALSTTASGSTLPALDPLDAPAGSTLDLSTSDVDRALETVNLRAGREDFFLSLSRSFDWLAARHQINFCLLGRNADDYLAWMAVGGEDGPSTELLRFIPPSRWRSPADFVGVPLMQQLAASLHEQSLRSYIHSVTRACYFLLLAVGDTGLEGFLDTYFDWLQDALSLDGTQFIDQLHRESTQGEYTLEETLNGIYDDHFADRLDGKPRSFTVGQLRKALGGFVHQLCEMNLSEVAPGHYNLGGFVLDHLLGLRYPSREFPFKIHRIV